MQLTKKFVCQSMNKHVYVLTKIMCYMFGHYLIMNKQY